MAHTRKAMLLVHNIGIMFVIMADKITGNNDLCNKRQLWPR